MSNKRNLKKNGAYYTPEALAVFIVSHLFKYSKKNNITILEPGCGDGRVANSLMEYLRARGGNKVVLDLVEKDPGELCKAVDKVKNYEDYVEKTSKFIEGDYLDFHFNDDTKYDLVIGNPPYIKKGHLSETQRDLIKSIHEEAGLKGSVKNIWTAFLVSAVLKLKKGGSLAFVLPAELMQTSYSGELRDFVLKSFGKVEIFSFQELVFEKIEQDVVVLVATRRSDRGCKKLEYIQLQNLDSLANVNEQKSSIHTHVNGTKWTNYILSEEELAFIKSLKAKLPKVGDYCSTSPGIVTAANSFFIRNKEFVETNHLTKYAKKILQKSSFYRNRIVFGKAEWNNLRDKGSPCYLLDFTAEPTLSKLATNYLKHGEDERIHKRYKCRRRHPWYAIPSLHTSEIVYGKRSSLYPRMMVNEENLLVTDSFYRIFMKENYSAMDLVYSFHNKLTFIFAELNGRQYGGGVLELTPSEFRGLPIPLVGANYRDVRSLDRKLVNEGIGSVLEMTDKHILQDFLNLSSKDMCILTGVYKKLLEKRIKEVSAQIFYNEEPALAEDPIYTPISVPALEFIQG